jgi:hypothetical protein
MSRTVLTLTIGALIALASSAHGQTLQQRIKYVQNKRANESRVQSNSGSIKPVIRLRNVVDPIDLEAVSAKRALEWWSNSTGIPLVVNWTALENQGFDRNKPITLKLRFIPAGRLLSMLIHEMAPDLGVDMMYQITPWYVRVITKEQANKMTVIRIFDIRDLLHSPPDFTNAPAFDLNSALSNTSSGGGQSGGGGGGGGGAGSSIFTSNTNDRDIETKSSSERGEEIAQLIRDSIAPDVWQANGGEYATIKYFNGQLVVKAPQYIQAQIGIPSRSLGRKGTNSIFVPGAKADPKGLDKKLAKAVK